MARNRFNSPDVERLPLTDDDWIEVHKDLNAGQQKKLEAAGLKPPVRVGDRVINPIDWEVYEFDRAVIFITDWSFRDKDDKPVKFSRAALLALTTEDFEEINQAIIEHAKARAMAKKSLAASNSSTTTPPSSGTSDSPSSEQK